VYEGPEKGKKGGKMREKEKKKYLLGKLLRGVALAESQDRSTLACA
jgi:hypothetical protein